VDLRNRRVHFKLRDIYHPDLTQVLMELHGEDVLTGTVVDMTDSGLQVGAYIVVEVEGLKGPVIVPAEQVLESL
jgi:hypothetical protein